MAVGEDEAALEVHHKSRCIVRGGTLIVKRTILGHPVEACAIAMVLVRIQWSAITQERT